MKTFIFIFLSLFTIQIHAQTETSLLPLSEEKFAAIVQYTKGQAPQEYKDLILFDKIIDVPRDAYIKVITQKRCIAVFYENTKVQSPINKVSPWKVLSGTARWICPEDKIEKVSYKDATIEVQNGEFLITDDQVTAIRDNVKYDGKKLQPENVYAYRKNKLLPLKNQPEPYDLWKKQEKFPAPLESARLKMEKPQDPYITRVFFNVAPFGISGLYNHELESHASDFKMESHFFRLGTNFPWKNKSIFTFIEFSDGKSHDRNNSMGPPPLGFKSIEYEATTLALGIRHSHVSSSSFYYYGGLTYQKVSTHLHPDFSTYYDSKVIYPYNLTAGGGYQKIFWARNWISLVVGLDFRITQSLTQGRYGDSNSFSSDVQLSAITEYAGFFYLGPTFNF